MQLLKCCSARNSRCPPTRRRADSLSWDGVQSSWQAQPPDGRLKLLSKFSLVCLACGHSISCLRFWDVTAMKAAHQTVKEKAIALLICKWTIEIWTNFSNMRTQEHCFVGVLGNKICTSTLLPLSLKLYECFPQVFPVAPSCSRWAIHVKDPLTLGPSCTQKCFTGLWSQWPQKMVLQSFSNSNVDILG